MGGHRSKRRGKRKRFRSRGVRKPSSVIIVNLVPDLGGVM